MAVPEGGELGQVRNAQHLVSLGQFPQFPPDDGSHPAADALIDFVEDQGRGLVGARQHTLQSQHQAGRFAPRGDLDQRFEPFAQVGRHQELDLVKPGGGVRQPAAVHRRTVWALACRDVHGEFGPVHTQRLQLKPNRLSQFGSSNPAGVGQLGAQRAHPTQELCVQARELFDPLAGVRDGLEFHPGVLGVGQDRLLAPAVLPTQVTDQPHPLLDLIQPPGVELN